MAYDMFSWYKYLSVILFFFHPSVGGVFLIAQFPDHCPLVPFCLDEHKLLSDRQHAIGKSHSCETGLATVIDEWSKI